MGHNQSNCRRDTNKQRLRADASWKIRTGGAYICLALIFQNIYLAFIYLPHEFYSELSCGATRPTVTSAASVLTCCVRAPWLGCLSFQKEPLAVTTGALFLQKGLSLCFFYPPSWMWRNRPIYPGLRAPDHPFTRIIQPTLLRRNKSSSSSGFTRFNHQQPFLRYAYMIICMGASDITHRRRM